MINSEQPAFASPGTYNPNNNEHNGDQQTGLTKREYFAAQAMKVLDPPIHYFGAKETEQSYKNWAYRVIMMADELLKQLEQ